jgi:hypothetical protein
MDAGKTLDRRAIEPDPFLHGFLQPPRGDGNAFDGAHDVRELQADELDTISHYLTTFSKSAFFVSLESMSFSYVY